MADASVNWKSIIVTAVVSGVIAVTTGFILYKVQIRQPRLQYWVEDTVPFETSSESHAIYHITIRNSGRSEVNHLVAHMSFGSASIVQRRVVAPASLTTTDTVNVNNYEVRAGNLNPGEQIVVSVVTRGTGRLPGKPQL